MPKKRVEKKIFSLDDLKPKKHYRIKVKSFNKDKKLIGESPWVIFKTTGKNQAPPNVTNLDADFRGRQLVVTWDAPWKESTTDFKDFVIKVESPGSSQEKIFAVVDEKFTFSADQNRNLFGSFRGTIKVTVYSRDRTNNQSSGVSVTAYAEVPEDPTNVRLSAATLGYNVSWDAPLFDNYFYTKIYESTSENGTYTVVANATGSSVFVRHGIETVWVKVSHVNSAGAESNLVRSVPPSTTPIDPVPSDVNPPNDPTNLNWEDAGLDTTNGITTARMRAHWQVTDIASGYKVRVTEDIVNKENWAVYDVPASKAKVTNKQILSNTATLTVTAHSFAVDDYITVFNVGSPFNGKHKITAVTSNTVSFSLTSSNINSTPSDGDIVISSYTVKELTPGTQYYGAILAYDGSNNLTQFVSEGTFTTSGTAGTVGSPIKIDGTTMAFGPNAGGTGKSGLHINSSNFWYTTGYFNVGTSGNSVSWNGTRLRLDGGIVARGGSFSGNVFLVGSNSTSSLSDNTASLIAAPSYSILTASWSAGTGTIVLQETPNPAWANGDRIIVAQASGDFDGEYTISSISGSTITFTMSSVSSTVPSITNVGKVSRINRGDRVIFNSFGIQGWENEEVDPVFSFNRNKTSVIGGWTIRPQRIFAGTGASAVGLSSNPTSSVRIYAGNDNPKIAPLVITSSGKLKINPLNQDQDGDLSSTDISLQLGKDVGGTGSNKHGLILNDLNASGIENFWYVPSQIANNTAYFRVGTANGSAITVQKVSGSTSKVKIKDYDVEGVATVTTGSKISINTVDIGKNIGPNNQDGIKIDGSNYWYDPSSVTSSTGIIFRAGGNNNNSLTVRKDGTVEYEGQTNPTGGTIKGMLQTTNGFKIGKDVVSTKDGIYLNANNFWYIGTSAGQEFKVGNATKSFSFDSSTGLLKIVGGDISLTGGGVITTSDSNTRVIMDSNGLYGYKAGTPTFSINAATGDAEFAGKVKKNATIGTSRIGIRDVDSGDTYPGLDIGSTLSINAGVNDASGTASIVFVRTGTTTAEGSIFPLTASKTASTEYGLGIGVSSGYPVVEVGWTDSARTNPRIRMTGGVSSRLEVGASRFVLEGNSSSRIIVPESAGTANKYLGRLNTNNEIAWVDPPASGGGGTTYTAGIGIDFTNNNTEINNSGYRMYGNTSGGNRTSVRNKITFATIPNVTHQDGDLHIEF